MRFSTQGPPYISENKNKRNAPMKVFSYFKGALLSLCDYYYYLMTGTLMSIESAMKVISVTVSGR